MLTGCSQPHYAVRQDLSIIFKNSDAVIASIRESLRKHDRKITVSYTSHQDNMQDIKILVRELMQYAVSETENPVEGDYISYQYGGYEMTYRYEMKNQIYNYEIEIIPEYYTTLEQEQEVSQKVSEILKSLKFSKSTPEDEKIKKIHDYVCEHVNYDLIHQKNEHYHLKVTAYGALLYGQAVCQGYAVAMYRLLKEAGIDVRIITGMAQKPDGTEEFHAWNLVKIGEFWYHLDATWDDETDSLDYFLKCDDSMTAHTRDEAFHTAEFYEAYPMAQQDYLF